ncbi:hypothetical protein BSLG_010552 [Batrachochytrium salamandrivorans]|nr:hypothetical protein BSLG_010552 [Batrachochytrium salamandrivorans]
MSSTVEQPVLAIPCPIEMPSTLYPESTMATSNTHDLYDKQTIQYGKTVNTNTNAHQLPLSHSPNQGVSAPSGFTEMAQLAFSDGHASTEKSVDAQAKLIQYAATILALPLDSSSPQSSYTAQMNAHMMPALNAMPMVDLPLSSHSNESTPQKPSEANQHVSFQQQGQDTMSSSTSSESSRPTIPYSTIITNALQGSTTGRLTLNDIYNFAMEQYPYFKTAGSGWKNSIRHNLSLNKNFVRTARPPNERGKGAYWMISPTAFAKKGRSRNRSVSDPNHKAAQQFSINSNWPALAHLEGLSSQQSQQMDQSQGLQPDQQHAFNLIPPDLFVRNSPDYTAVSLDNFDKQHNAIHTLQQLSDTLSSSSISASNNMRAMEHSSSLPQTSLGNLVNTTAGMANLQANQGRPLSMPRRHTYQNSRALPPEIVNLRRAYDDNSRFSSSTFFDTDVGDIDASSLTGFASAYGAGSTPSGTVDQVATSSDTSANALSAAAVAHATLQQNLSSQRQNSFKQMSSFLPDQLTYNNMGLADGNSQVLYNTQTGVHEPRYFNEVMSEEERRNLQQSGMFQPTFFNGSTTDMLQGDAGTVGASGDMSGCQVDRQPTWLSAHSQESSYGDLGIAGYTENNGSLNMAQQLASPHMSMSQQGAPGYFLYRNSASDLECLPGLPEETNMPYVYNVGSDVEQSIMRAAAAATAAATTPSNTHGSRRNSVGAFVETVGLPLSMQRRTSFQYPRGPHTAVHNHGATQPQYVNGLIGVPGQLDLGDSSVDEFKWEPMA